MPEQEPLLPQETEVKQSPAGFDSVKEEEVFEPGPPVYLVDGIAKPAKWTVNGKYCYEQDDLDRYIKQLEKDGVKYTVEEVVPPAELYVTNGVKYANVDEAVKHINNVSAPDSLTIPYLQEKIKVTEDWLAAALTKIAEIETVTITELSDKVRVLEEAAVKEEIVKEETIIKR